ncbi:hypothetical protein [Actinomadura nitritigenes]|uniref:hypothetical protein n=1 Tax=Actinomadura nitritigenes TaxID=134602 RepID=UPI003D908AA2
MTRRLLDDLAGRLVARGWTGALDGQEQVVLRVWPPGTYPDPRRMAEIVVRDGGDGAYFAYTRTQNRPIAPVKQTDRAVRAIVHVHGGTITPPPPISPQLIALFGDSDSEPS